MSVSIMPVVYNTGVRRLHTLGGYRHGISGLERTLGTAPQQYTLDLFASSGYDMATINTLVAVGATDDQLLLLMNTTDPGTTQFADAAAALMAQLTGASPAPGSPMNLPAPPTSTVVDSAFGLYDLAQQSAWDAIAALFGQTQINLNSLARQYPGDANVINFMNQYNSLVAQYASYYSQAFGNAPSSLPLATLGGLGIAPVIILAGLVAGVAIVLATLYTLNQAIAAYQAAKLVAPAATAAANVGSLTNTYQQQVAAANAAAAAGNSTLAAQMNTQAQQTLNAIRSLGVAAPPPGAPATGFTAWLQANAGMLMMGLVAVVVVPSFLGGGRRR
jgi:hypothetical protein